MGLGRDRLNGFKIHVFDVKNSQNEHDLSTSVNGRVIWPFPWFYFYETSSLPSFEKIKKNLSKFSEFTVQLIDYNLCFLIC